MTALDLFAFRERYPDAPGFKARGTSAEAAAGMKPRAATLRDEVLAAIKARGHFGLTADEAARRLGETPLSVRPRLSELHAQGLIRDTGRRRLNVSGRRAAVWVSC